MRILVDLSEENVRWLDRQAEERGQSRASLLRDAVSLYRLNLSGEGVERAFGAWGDRSDIGDGLAYERAIRSRRAPSGGAA